MRTAPLLLAQRGANESLPKDITMNPTILAGLPGTITARPGGYVAVHPAGHSSHGPLSTMAAAVDALDHLASTGMWPEVTA